MAKVLVTWELGGGLGHLMRLQPIALMLEAIGHDVTFALRDLSQLKQVFGDANFQSVQTPAAEYSTTGTYSEASCFAHVLLREGFADVDALHRRCLAWQSIYDEVRPDFVLFDHSPSALLASRGYGFRTASIGTGFCCPPDAYPLLNWRPWRGQTEADLRQDEQLVADSINAVLDRFGQPELSGIGGLYKCVDRVFLQTYPELDHFPNRVNGQYFGFPPDTAGDQPIWPLCAGKRIYAYLSRSPFLSPLIETLAQFQLPTIVFCTALCEADRQLYQKRFPNLSITCDQLDLAVVAQESDLAVHHGSHGIAVSFLLAAKPAVVFPIQLEQRITCVNLHRLGAARMANPYKRLEVIDSFHDVLTSDSYRQSAGAFAQKYASWDREASLRWIVDMICSLLPN